MGPGLHHRTFQALLGVMHFGQTVDEAIDTPDFFYPDTDPATFHLTFRVPTGGFPREVLDGTGYAYEELDPTQARLSGEGLWVAVSRDPETGELRAASHNRNNSAAVAWQAGQTSLPSVSSFFTTAHPSAWVTLTATVALTRFP